MRMLIFGSIGTLLFVLHVKEYLPVHTVRVMQVFVCLGENEVFLQVSTEHFKSVLSILTMNNCLWL